MNRYNIMAELKAAGSSLTDEEMASLSLADLILARDAVSEPDDFELDYSSKPITPWHVERPSRSVAPKREQAIDSAVMRSLARQHAKEDANNRALERAIGQVSAGTLKRSYQARVRHQGAQVYLGVYRTKAEADEAVFKFKIGIASTNH